MKKHRRIFHQLLLLALLSAVPLTGILGYVAVDGYVNRRQAAAADLRVARDNAVQRLQRFVRETAAQARLLAQASELTDPSEAKRDAFLSRFAVLHPEFVNLYWADQAGMVRSSARYRANYPATSVLADELLRELLARPGTVVSRGVLGTVSRRWSFYFVEQIREGPGGEPGAFILPVDLQTITPRLLDRRVARGERVTVFDDTGRILMDSHEPTRLISLVYPEFARLRGDPTDDALRHRQPGIAGAPPFSATVAGVPGTPWLVAAHLPTEIVLDEPRRGLFLNLAGTLVVFAALMLMVRRQTRLIAGPIRQLAEAAQAQTEGRYETMAPVAGPAEVMATAEAFNQMVAARRAAESAMREATRRYEALVNSIDGIVWEFDSTTGRFLFISPRAEAIVGYPIRQWLEEENFWVKHLHPDDREWASRYCREAIREGRDHELDYRFMAADGRTVWFHDIATVAREGDGSPRTRGVMFDVTARKSAESERQALERKILETQKLESLGVLAGGIAHDFNNLLTGILGNANLAQLELPHGHQAQEYMAQIETASRRAADLCRQMLAYSGKGRFVIQRVDVNQVVRDLLHLLEISISKQAVLRMNLAARLPAFEADVTQLRQVMMNLVINASEALQEHNGVIALTTGVVRADADYLRATGFVPEPAPGDYVFLEVSDNGCGMDEATRARIFDPFFTTKFTGRGLGLAAVLGIVRGHRGAIKVYSEPGKGTSFKLLFPIAEGEAVDLQADSGANVTSWRGSGCVLVIDDEETVRSVAARMLQRVGFTAESTADPRDGLAKFAREPARYALVLLDLTMPHLNGEEVFLQMRTIRPDLKVILMSGFNEQEAISRFTGKGLAGFVQKPIALDDLIAMVRRVLESE